MTGTVLQISLMLLLLNVRASLFTSAAGRCISNDRLGTRTDKFYKYWNQTLTSKILEPDARSCAQAARDMRGHVRKRSLSPWTYHFNHDVNRIPQTISFAKCLCAGCIIGRRENGDYNSVPVLSELKVLKKTPCPSDPKRFVVEEDYIEVPVACTCVKPNYMK